MEVAFDREQVDFGNMCPVTPVLVVYIGEVKHKTFVDVNEEGTEELLSLLVCYSCHPPH